MLDIIGQCEGPKGPKRNSSVSQCRLLGAKRTSISGAWRSPCSQDETLVVHTATAFWHIAMTVTGTVYR